jgi:prepilin-type N-terminal cleavage/methylation domain-containing protein
MRARAARHCLRLRPAQRGFTLMELIIGIALMGALSAGMLMSMRNGLLTMERANARIDENRRAMGALSLIRRQVGGVIPARGLCPGQGNAPVEFFHGDGATMVLVSSESIAQGARGYPQIARYQFRSNLDGTVRLEVIEQPFGGPYSTLPYCQPGQAGLQIQNGMPVPVVLYDRLASGRFVYYWAEPFTRVTQGWLASWTLPYMPEAVRIEMALAANSTSRLPLMNITVPLRISREPGAQYKDEIPVNTDDDK